MPNIFPVQDITHKPRRTQQANLIAAGVTEKESENNDREYGEVSSIPLHSVTLERAIAYYEANAKGEYLTLYKNTAKWLRQLLATDRFLVRKAEEAEKSENNEIGTAQERTAEEAT